MQRRHEIPSNQELDTILRDKFGVSAEDIRQFDPESIHDRFAEETSIRGTVRGIGETFADIGRTFFRGL